MKILIDISEYELTSLEYDLRASDGEFLSKIIKSYKQVESNKQFNDKIKELIRYVKVVLPDGCRGLDCDACHYDDRIFSDDICIIGQFINNIKKRE
jgi:uncharacterized ubiquitin-like protein YukD